MQECGGENDEQCKKILDVLYATEASRLKTEFMLHENCTVFRKALPCQMKTTCLSSRMKTIRPAD